MVADLDKLSGVDAVQPNLGDTRSVARIFVHDDWALPVDGGIVEQTLAFTTTQQNLDAAALFGIFNIIEAQPPETAICR